MTIDLEHLERDVGNAVRRCAADVPDPHQLARRLARELRQLDPQLASCVDVRVIGEDPDETLVREVMEEPQDEIRFEVTMQTAHPMQYIRCDVQVVK